MLGKTARKVQHKRQQQRNMKRSGPGPSTIVYKGPLNVEMKEDAPVAVNAGIYVPIATAAVSNTITWNSVYNASPTGLADWTDWSALYQEFRVLGIKLLWMPTQINATLSETINGPLNPGFYNAGPLMVAPYHGDATAFSTYNNAFNHYGVKITTINQKLVHTVRMNEVDEAQWFSTSSGTSPTMGFKVFWTATTTGATNAPPVGTIFLMFTLQFRGRVATGAQLSKQKELKDKKEVKSDYKDMDRDIKLVGLSVSSDSSKQKCAPKENWAEVGVVDETITIPRTVFDKLKNK